MTDTLLTMGLVGDGNPPEFWVAQVTHVFENEHHVFTSETIEGLLIVERDAKKAFAQVVPTIQRLIWHSKKQNVKVKLGADFKEFEKAHCGSPVIHPQNRTMFAVIQKAA